MNGSSRDDAPFSGRVWQEIDQTIASVRAANCTARRFLEIDGPYGLGLTSVAGKEGWLPPVTQGANYHAWNVQRAHGRAPGTEPTCVGAGTYLVSAGARPVPLIASEFELGMRAIEAYDAGCQPLDLCPATRAARDVALEEERLIYYGSGDHGSQALLDIIPLNGSERNFTPLTMPREAPPAEAGEPRAIERAEGRALIDALHEAIEALASRGYAGPFALTVDAGLYADIYAPNYGEDTLRVDLIRGLFRGGIHMAPVIAGSDPRRGAIVTLGRAYSRLVVGQDWVTCYRGRDGVMYRLLIMSSLQFRVCDPRSIQVLKAMPPNITGYQNTSGQSIPEAEAGTAIVIAGSNLGSPGTVFFDAAGSSAPTTVLCWSPNAVIVRVPSFGEDPVEATVTVAPDVGPRMTGPPLRINPRRAGQSGE
jgi:uncharacterized linocin/CFP29 family protein